MCVPQLYFLLSSIHRTAALSFILSETETAHVYYVDENEVRKKPKNGDIKKKNKKQNARKPNHHNIYIDSIYGKV